MKVVNKSTEVKFHLYCEYPDVKFKQYKIIVMDNRKTFSQKTEIPFGNTGLYCPVNTNAIFHISVL